MSTTTTPSVVVEEEEGKKKGRKPFWPLFSPLVPPIISISLSLSSLSVDIIPNADYPPRCPTQVTHHPSLCVSSLFIPPEYTKDIHAQDRPFKSEHSSSRAQNASPLPTPCGSVGPLPSGSACCYKVLLLLLPAFPGVCVACVLCPRRPHRNAKRKKEKKKKIL